MEWRRAAKNKADRRRGVPVAGPPISVETPTVAAADARDLAAAQPPARHCPDPAWDGCFAAHNLDPVPDDPARRVNDLPRFV